MIVYQAKKCETDGTLIKMIWICVFHWQKRYFFGLVNESSQWLEEGGWPQAPIRSFFVSGGHHGINFTCTLSVCHIDPLETKHGGHNFLKKKKRVMSWECTCCSAIQSKNIFVEFWLSPLRTPELVGLAHHFCASFCLYSRKFREKNQIKINLMKHGMCNIHINDYYSKYFV